MFSVLEFLEEEAVEVVLSSWVNSDGNLCKYPDTGTAGSVTKLVLNKTEAKDTWPIYQCRILKQSGKLMCCKVHKHDFLIHFKLQMTI